MTARPMFPPTVDSTMLAAFRNCPQKMFRTYVEHWKPQFESVHLVAGGAYAKGLETARRAFYSDKLSPDDALSLGGAALMEHYGDFECPADSAKSLERTLGALEYYFEQYPLGSDPAIPIEYATGRQGIEFSFAEPLDIMHPISGDPLIYTGRADMLAHWNDGIYVFDDKTTSSLGASFARQWEHRSQFTGYLWAAQRAGIRTHGAVVRGVSILKAKYDTMEVVTNRSPWEIERWYIQMQRDIQRMIRCWEEGYWDYNLDHACNEYGQCSLTDICKSPNPEAWLPAKFTKRVWDPLARAEKTVEEWEAEWETCKIPVAVIQ